MVDFSQMTDEQLTTAKKIRDEAVSQGVDPAYALSIGHIESGFNPKAKAPTSTAQGPMQLIKGTAQELNVDPTNTDENIKGGVSYLKQHLDKYKDPLVSAIAYKAGPGVADKFMQSKDLSSLDDETLKYLKEVKQRYQPQAKQEAKPAQVQTQKEPGVESTSLLLDEPVKLISEGVEYLKEKGPSLFTPGEERPFQAGKAVEQAKGGFMGGAITGAVGPKVTEIGGKVLSKVPGPVGAIGKAAETFGKMWGATPIAARTAGGAVGGATLGASEELLDSYGFSPASKFAVGTALSAGGEGLGTFLGKEVKQVGKLIGSAALGSWGGVVNSIAGMAKPNKDTFLKEAEVAQEKAFGKRIKGYTEGVIGNANQGGTTALLREKYGVPADFEGPASAYLRDQVIKPKVSEISIAKQNPNKFSSSDAFTKLETELNRLEAKGTIGKAQKKDLLLKLESDRSPYEKTRAEFADTIDNAIREWGKGAEKQTPTTGFAAVGLKEQKDIREAIRSSYNEWLSGLGLGNAEREYRNAYRAESLAELKDHINHSLTYIDQTKAFDKLAPLIKDGTYSKQDVLDGVRTYLANVSPEEVVTKFTKLDKALVGNELLPKQDMMYFEKAAKDIKLATEKGAKKSKTENFARALIKQISYRAGSAAGEAQYESGGAFQ